MAHKNNILLASFFAVLMLGLCPSAGTAQPSSERTVTITTPARDGLQVGLDMKVSGQASNLPNGEYVWVLAHRADFGKMWWPQRQTVPDSKTGQWIAQVVFGGPQDVGYEFEIAVITVNETEHLKLQAYWEEAMLTTKWPPIRMPSTASPPVIRKVMKASHN